MVHSKWLTEMEFVRGDAQPFSPARFAGAGGFQQFSKDRALATALLNRPYHLPFTDQNAGIGT